MNEVEMNLVYRNQQVSVTLGVHINSSKEVDNQLFSKEILITPRYILVNLSNKPIGVAQFQTNFENDHKKITFLMPN